MTQTIMIINDTRLINSFSSFFDYLIIGKVFLFFYMSHIYYLGLRPSEVVILSGIKVKVQ